ncbi:hypothetical protein DCS_07551 [Drechmeria coniospora]|uniref:Zn(2)-C6 fungal-type domain-containing protein n=1 Tax=Drechmeria coniospora TaxID=98403 RepID=A0A151GES4_DRECN|nr:hypothetical protein DCS_07551 [Drechmeria coniospora]KYK55588.1 hypothetical protein DCS_07551 [Drechmeria coniospora]ODA81804.1 hypothetical protein RJ55_00308 [Drechmeria coniospora]
MTSKSAKNPSASDVPTHRACDECRARKLACTKEVDGCVRCKREGVLCHYSPQKPMGRPRKRRHVPSAVGASGLVGGPAADELVSPPKDGGIDARVQLSGTNLDFFSQDTDPSLDFLDLLPAGFHDDGGDDLFGPHPLGAPPISTLNDLFLDDPAASVPCTDAGLEGFDFCVPRSPRTAVFDGTGDSFELWTPSRRSTPHRQTPVPCHGCLPGAAESPEPVPGGPLKAMPNTSCGCLASLYLALESLSRLPSDATSATRVARDACNVAQNVVDCRNCSNAFLDDPTKPPPIQSFQNLMFLGALLPSACNSYASILEMVDEECAAAKRENRTIYFSFEGVAGHWGDVVETQGHCAAMKRLDGCCLPPDIWRTTMRAILRLDIYGQDESRCNAPSAVCRQRGLRDVLKQMDETSRRRHEVMDELYANGQAPKHSHFMMSPANRPPCPPEQRNCVRILDTARLALESLVIA